MKNLILIIIFTAAGNICLSLDQIDIFFYNELQADFYEFEQFRLFQEKVTSDTILSQHIFTGRILNKYEGDIFPLAFLNYVKCDLAAPTDIRFNVNNSNLSFKLLAANILSDTLSILPYQIISSDSLKIALFSIYTPDFAVKNQLSHKVELDPNVFALTRTMAEYLGNQADQVILISSLSKYIDSDLVQGLPIDVVLSSDYQKKSDGLLSSGVKFYSIVSKMSKVGRLRIVYSNGKIDHYWTEEPIVLTEETQEELEEPDAAGDR